MQGPEGFDPNEVAPPLQREGRFPIQMLALDVSGRCNIACRYCAESATLPQRQAMSPEVLELAWEWFGGQRSSRSWSVRLGSGEPLLALPLMKRIDALVRAARGDAAGDPPVCVSTNGTLIDEAAGEWLAASGWEVKVSLDGPRTTHDRWRVGRDGGGTFDRVEPTARWLASRLGGRLTIVSVLARGGDPFEAFDAVTAIGARWMEFIPVATRDPEIRLGPSDLERYQAFISEYARRRRDDERVAPLVARFERYVPRVMGYHNQRVVCGAGRDYVGVGPDGALYPCMRFIGIGRYKLGHLPVGVDQAAALAFRRGPGRAYDQRDACRACWAAPICCGPCFACAEMFDMESLCQVYRAEAAAAVWLVQQLRARNPERLLSFLGV